MRVVIRVRADAGGYYAHARGKILSDPMPREKAERIFRITPNSHEWEIVDA